MDIVLKPLPSYLLDNYVKNPTGVAFREKDYGIWNEYTWQDYLGLISKVAYYFQECGLKNGDTVAIVGDNKPEWVISEIASQLLRAYPVGIYQDSIVSEVEYILKKTNAKIVVAEDQEQVDKILEIIDNVPSILKIIYYDKKGMYQYDDDRLVFFDDIVNNNYNIKLEEYFKDKLQFVTLDDVAVMCTTSGTTGFPKIAMLSHKNLSFMSRSLGKADPKFEKDEFVSFLPLPWIGEQMMCIASALMYGFKVNFPENHDTVQNDMKEIGPNLIFSPPRVWENLAATVQMNIMDSSRLKKWIYNKCLPIGYSYAESKFNKQSLTFLGKLKYKIAYYAVFRKLKERLGFTNVRSAITGGAALGPDTFKFFHALGINLKQIYGQTKISGI
ncbi:MAG: AMP-binding protein, partial [Deferribacterales bacterium]|nr:AMP-binding protein [Deferribacterales bacterium]